MYLLQGKLTAKSGLKRQLSEILIEASHLVATAPGCKLYLISKDENVDSEDVYVTEIWSNKEDHDNSLKITGVKELIALAVPILEEMPKKGQELRILGGYGI
jgi:quinol monooxygenase YgiN